MYFKYSCFISYPHGQGELMEEFIKQLKKALKAYLGPWLSEEVYIDEERLKTGFFYNEALASAICQSIGMIVVYSPIYERHTYCLREYMAMEDLQEKRKQMLGGNVDPTRGMIYPIILRGNIDDLPLKIKGNIHYCDFSKFTLATLDISKNQEYICKIDQIAADIYEHYKVLKGMKEINGIDCRSFKLPSEEETLRSWEKSRKSIGFPGREVIL